MSEYIITDEQLDKLANKHERIIVLRSDCGDAFPVSMEGEILRGLVRCRDCKYLIPRGACEYWDYCDVENEDGFCAWGEQRGDAE